MLSCGNQQVVVGECFRATFGWQSWAGVWRPGWAKAHGIGAGASARKELVRVAPLQTPCRTAYGGRTLPNALGIKALIFKYKHVFNSPQGIQ